VVLGLAAIGASAVAERSVDAKFLRKILLLLEKAHGLLTFGFLIPPFGGMQNFTRMQFLYNSILRFAKPSSGIALEVGVYKAGSIIFLAMGCLRKGIVRIYGIDLFPAGIMEAAKRMIRKHGLDEHVTLIKAQSREYAWDKSIDVLHLDADHTYEAVISDVRKYAPFVTSGGIMIFDDYDTSHPGVRKAVSEFLLEEDEFEIVAINYEGQAYGSICLRKRDESSDVGVAKWNVNLLDRLLKRC
jgi:predicted O-methyltransferase YrrM